MPAEIYEIVAQGARYWFLFLMALIAWRSYRWYVRERRQRKKRLRLLPDAGFVGEMVVLRGNDELKRGVALPVPKEGTLGFSRMNDLCVPVKGVSKRHCWFCYDPKRGLTMEPYFRKTIEIDGQARTGRRNPLCMAHGSRLVVGGAELRLRMFAGFEGSGAGVVGFRAEAPELENGEASSASGLTPEQAAAWQQAMAQQQYMQQMAYMQWMSREWARHAQSPAEPDQQSGGDMPLAYGDQPQATPVHEPEEEPDSFRQAADISFAPEAGRSHQLEFDTDGQFYPPVGNAEEDDWPYAPYPYAAGENGLQPQPEAVDDDLPDAALPPKSAYVGHDEAETAKKRFWDRYLGGGDRT